ncbi:MAG TPA: hypothetical protein VKN99_11355 [Polyangia bacterium]|nr:hypothetical protein [Polyangia bacterium]
MAFLWVQGRRARVIPQLLDELTGVDENVRDVGPFPQDPNPRNVWWHRRGFLRGRWFDYTTVVSEANHGEGDASPAAPKDQRLARIVVADCQAVHFAPKSPEAIGEQNGEDAPFLRASHDERSVSHFAVSLENQAAIRIEKEDARAPCEATLLDQDDETLSLFGSRETATQSEE